VTSPSPALRRLTLATLAATVALVVLGGIVRVSDSGLGCGPAGSGFNGWPLCRGDIVPGLDLNAVIEYAHRALGSVVGLLVLALAAVAWRRHRAHRDVVRASTAAAALVVAQGLLGAATVERNLDPALVAAHLCLAMLLVGLLLYVLRLTHPRAGGDPAPAAGRGLRLLSVATAALVLLTIVAGGYMAGTEKHGRTDHQPSSGAHYACGYEFPTCNGSFMPFGQSALADVHLTHRAFMYGASVALLALVVAAVRRRPSASVVRSAWVALGLLVLQIALGAANVWVRTEYELLIVAHLTVATLLWARVVWLALDLRVAPLRAGAAERARGPAVAA
jgi:heme A synthase